MFSITFTNPFGVAIQLQVSAGQYQNCDQNGTVYNGQLGPNASWTLNSDQNVVCWRRTANPGQPGSPFNQWGTFSPNDINTPANIQL